MEEPGSKQNPSAEYQMAPAYISGDSILELLICLAGDLPLSEHLTRTVLLNLHFFFPKWNIALSTSYYQQSIIVDIEFELTGKSKSFGCQGELS